MTLAANIRARRKSLRWSQKELAQRAGVSQQLINALEADRVGSSKFIRDIATALACTIVDLDPGYGGMAEESVPIIKTAAQLGDLPIFGSSDVDNMSVTVSDQPIDFIDRPDPLQNVIGGYGVLISANLMFPEFQTGDLALINPHLPPVPDTACIFYSTSEPHKLARIRRLLHISQDQWTVKAWQPPEGAKAVTEMARDTWQKCHRIVGRYYHR
jgi:transcriptional regulator with XRE-family HTH domain